MNGFHINRKVGAIGAIEVILIPSVQIISVSAPFCQ
jgi:hypothetical protein